MKTIYRLARQSKTYEEFKKKVDLLYCGRDTKTPDIMNTLLKGTDVSVGEIKSTARHRHIVDCRMVIGYLLYHEFNFTRQKAGLSINRDHSTIVYYSRTLPALLDVNDSDFMEKYDIIMNNYRIYCNSKK